MPRQDKDVQLTNLNGMDMPLPQHEKKDGSMAVTGENNPMPVKSSVKDVVLHDVVTATGNGTALAVGDTKTLTIEVYGTSTSRTLVFEAAGVTGTFYPVKGIKLTDLSMDTQTTGSGELWQFDLTGVVQFRARLTAVAGGNVSVKGKAVS
ncbi:hypothetical protein ACQKM1_22295 [Peribacillus frigoritolerans]|uniref:hypothetical protein n=1 Tax=Peribacillus frigoritolerans TaxID=450367 RepID=UPI003D006801